jgi:hypothetical protein
MATDPESEFRPQTKSSTESLAGFGFLLLLAAGLIWAYLPANELPQPRADSSRTYIVETRPNTPGAAQDPKSTEAVEQSDRPDRPADVPLVRLFNPSDEAGYLRGSVTNDTGRPIERLRLRITTSKWADRTFDVKVKVDHNATALFSFSVGEAGLRVESFRVVGPNG